MKGAVTNFAVYTRPHEVVTSHRRADEEAIHRQLGELGEQVCLSATGNNTPNDDQHVLSTAVRRAEKSHENGAVPCA